MSVIDDDPLLQLYGDGKEPWADEHSGRYVRRIRESWDEAAERRENSLRPNAAPSDGCPK